MKGVNWVRASTTDDGVSAFDQEAFVDESPTLEEGGLEATINNLVGIPSKFFWFLLSFKAYVLVRVCEKYGIIN